MSYTFNAHRHVKIWLSKDKNSFLNFENQKRLIKMRSLNPNDEINFAYDSRLLSETAHENLVRFCQKHSLTPVDIAQIKLKNSREQQLFAHYNNEIMNLESGGNLGAASDIARWLSDIYELGSYTDFDVEVDTRKLPQTIEVEKPLLLSLGSVVHKANCENLAPNNDRIAIVDAVAATQKIQQIQNSILDGLENKNIFNDYLNTQKSAFRLAGYSDLEINIQMQSEVQVSELLNTIRKRSASIVDLRHNVIRQFSSNSKFCESKKMSVKVLAESLRELASSWLFWLITPRYAYLQLKEMAAIENDDELVTKMRETELHTHLRATVVNTTGPFALIKGLFSGCTFTQTSKINKIASYSFNHYGLDQAFYSKNSIPFHTSISELFNLISAAEIGVSNDLSWLELGQAATRQREDILRQKQIAFSLVLPENLANLKEKIEKHVEKTTSDLNGCLGFYRRYAREQKKSALTEILRLFTGNTFNKKELEPILAKYSSEDLFAGIGWSNTETLINELRQLAHKATVYQLDDETGAVAFGRMI